MLAPNQITHRVNERTVAAKTRRKIGKIENHSVLALVLICWRTNFIPCQWWAVGFILISHDTIALNHFSPKKFYSLHVFSSCWNFDVIRTNSQQSTIKSATIFKICVCSNRKSVKPRTQRLPLIEQLSKSVHHTLKYII